MRPPSVILSAAKDLTNKLWLSSGERRRTLLAGSLAVFAARDDNGFLPRID